MENKVKGFAALLLGLAAVLLLHNWLIVSRAPLLSVVVVGDLATDAQRFGEFLAVFSRNLEAFAPQLGTVEVVFVCWNAAPSSVCWSPHAWPTVLPRLQVRVLPVESAVHEAALVRLGADAEGERFLEYEAKNVGVRAARGTYVLATNVDILLSVCAVKHLNRHLRDIANPSRLYGEASSVFWRAYRSDLKGGVFQTLLLEDSDQTLESYLSTAEQKVQSRMGLIDGVWWPRILENEKSLPTTEILTNAAGDFTLMSRNWWIQSGGYTSLPFAWHMDSLLLFRLQLLGLKQHIFPCRVYHRPHLTRGHGRPRAHIFRHFLKQLSLSNATAEPSKKHLVSFGKK